MFLINVKIPLNAFMFLFSGEATHGDLQHLLPGVWSARVPPQPREAGSFPAPERARSTCHRWPTETEVVEKVGQSRRNCFGQLVRGLVYSQRCRASVLHRLK